MVSFVWEALVKETNLSALKIYFNSQLDRIVGKVLLFQGVIMPFLTELDSPPPTFRLMLSLKIFNEFLEIRMGWKY